MRVWTITKNHIEPEAAITMSTKATKEMLKSYNIKASEYAKKNGERFKLYDDDGELYAEGYIWQCEDDDGENILKPLDYFMYNYGATYMKMRSKATGKYEIV